MVQEPLSVMLRRLRRARGWSQERLAETLRAVSGRDTVTRQEVYRWEAGRRTPTFWLPWLARVFGVPREVLELAAVTEQTPALDELLPPEPVPAGAGGREVGAEAAAQLMARVHGLRLADDVLAGRDLLPVAYRELDSALQLHRDSSQTEWVGRALLVAIAELAQIAGWIAYDAGQHARAEETYRLGMSAAREAGDAALAGQLAGCLAYQWSNTGRESDAVELAKAAVDEGASAPPRARALFWDRLAWAATKTGDAQGAMRALGEAERALTAHNGEDEPAWVYWVSGDELQVMAARCYTELRRPLRAVPLLTQTLARYDVTRARELGLYLSWLAVAYIDANEPEQAAAVARRMLDVSASVGSDRAEGRARLVIQRLEPFRELPEVDDVLVRQVL